MIGRRSRIKFTYEDYRNAPEDRRYELLDGELIMVPSPRYYHQRTSIRLSSRLHIFTEEAGVGTVLEAPFDVVLSDFDVVQPDILFVSRERSHIITDESVRGAPDLIVEILSPTTAERDRTYKLTLYANHGVREYWLVDPDTRTVEVLELAEQGYKLAARYTKDDTLQSPMLRGFSLDLSEVF